MPLLRWPPYADTQAMLAKNKSIYDIYLSIPAPLSLYYIYLFSPPYKPPPFWPLCKSEPGSLHGANFTFFWLGLPNGCENYI